MAGNYYYQIKTEQALVALEARMEMEELEAYKTQLSAVISSPLEVYRKFVANSLRPLSVSVTKSAGGPYCQLDREVTGLLNRYTLPTLPPLYPLPPQPAREGGRPERSPEVAAA